MRPAKTQISLRNRAVRSVFAVRCSIGSYGPKISSCGQRRPWTDWADAQADLSLCWGHISFCWFCFVTHLKTKNTFWWQLTSTDLSSITDRRWKIVISLGTVRPLHTSRLMTKPKNECAPSEDSDQFGHSPSLIRVFAVPMKKAWVLSYSLSAQQRLWSDWANAQADLSFH